MPSTRKALVLAFALTLAAVARAALQFADGDEETVVLLQFGSADATVSVLSTASGPDVSVEVSSSPLYVVGAVVATDADGSDYAGYTNYTIPFSFDGDVGKTDFDVTVGTESVNGSITVAGVVIKSSAGIVSGEDGPGVSVGLTGTTTYDVMAVATDGTTADVSGAVITKRSSTSVDMKEVNLEKTKITSSKFTLVLNDYRVGAGMFNLDMEFPNIEKMGESHETSLMVKRDSSADPPCVAMAGTVKTVDGVAMVTMINLLSPPRGSPVDTVTITIGSASYDWDKAKSTLEIPDQTVAFPVSSYGAATIQCDGADAVIDGGSLTIEQGEGDSGPALASTLLSPPLQPTDSIVTAVIRILDESASTITVPKVASVLSTFCSTIGSSGCVLTGLKEGSAVCEMQGYAGGDATTAEQNLRDSFGDCSFQTEAKYPCRQLELTNSQVNVMGTAAAPTGTALALWTIVLIAGLGAFALIVVIMLGLLAVYRRSAEQSESDYSSSGPLGVPDPSDLLYEQSIVRDIYGRGDYPEGGPTAAVAEQRAREADLREEFPRPPSSSGLSRASDDASSTYSV